MMQLWDQVADDVVVRRRRKRREAGTEQVVVMVAVEGERGGRCYGGRFEFETEHKSTTQILHSSLAEPASDTRPLCCRRCVLPATDASLNSSFYLLHQGSPIRPLSIGAIFVLTFLLLHSTTWYPIHYFIYSSFPAFFFFLFIWAIVFLSIIIFNDLRRLVVMMPSFFLGLTVSYQRCIEFFVCWNRTSAYAV